ncbi:MAG: carbonic anhydrase [Corynebacterium sp.]|nr:carbonic anhydrase [Corynebacterium sp.]
MDSKTPQEAWEALAAGNKRFTSNEELLHPNRGAVRRHELTTGQNPYACVFGCSDSRVPPELLFDAGLGDIFSVRTAGETLDLAVLGSLEFAVVALKVKVLVVLAHEKCGAVAATAAALEGDGIPDAAQRFLVEKVSPAAFMSVAEGDTATDAMEIRQALETVDQIPKLSPAIAAAVERREVMLVAARYTLDDGAVTRLN